MPSETAGQQRVPSSGTPQTEGHRNRASPQDRPEAAPPSTARPSPARRWPRGRSRPAINGGIAACRLARQAPVATSIEKRAGGRPPRAAGASVTETRRPLRSFGCRPRRIRPRCSPGFAVYDAKPASADLVGHDPHEPLFRCSVPWEQRQIGRVEEFVDTCDFLSTTFHHDTPGLTRIGFEPVRLESNVALDRAGELGALGRPEDDSAVIHDVVDGKDLWSVGDRDCQSPHLVRPQ
jgi:hypothetical protein